MLLPEPTSHSLDFRRPIKSMISHIEPFQDPSLRQTSFHIVLYMFKDSVASPGLNTIPHELYNIRRDPDGNLLVHNL